MQTFIAYSPEPPSYKTDPVEVEEIIELSVTWLLNEAAVKRGKGEAEQRVIIESPYFEVAGHMVWGRP